MCVIGIHVTRNIIGSNESDKFCFMVFFSKESRVFRIHGVDISLLDGVLLTHQILFLFYDDSHMSNFKQIMFVYIPECKNIHLQELAALYSCLESSLTQIVHMCSLAAILFGLLNLLTPLN